MLAIPDRICVTSGTSRRQLKPAEFFILAASGSLQIFFFVVFFFVVVVFYRYLLQI